MTLKKPGRKLKELPEKLNPGLGLVIKKLLLFSGLALFFAAGAVGVVFISAQVISPPEEVELEIAPRGAENDYQSLAAEQLEQQDLLRESLAAADNAQHRARSESLENIETRLEQLLESRSLLIDRESERIRQEGMRDRERELAEFEQDRRARASREIASLQAEIEERIAGIDIGYDPDDEELLRKIRRQALEDHREELLSIRIKLRTLILSAERDTELRGRLEAIENMVEARVEQVRAGLDAQIDQQIFREAARLRLEFVAAQEQIQEEARRDIAARESELEEEQLAWDQSEEERVAAELGEIESRVMSQYSRLRQSQLDYW